MRGRQPVLLPTGNGNGALTVYPRKNLMVIRGHNLTAPWLLMTSLTAHCTLVLKYLAWIFEAVLSDISKTSAFVKKT